MGIQHCNVACLPENYTLKYYYYHYLNWSSLIYVAEDRSKSRVVGYVLASQAEEDEKETEPRGHITSISVLRDYRRLGIAKKVMDRTHQAMREVYGLKSVTLHVRASNTAAISLYKEKLGYDVAEVDVGYYADGEDALLMKKIL